jgi:hypothetical protein
MINNLVSINVVMQEIVRDLHIGEVSLPYADIKEWIIDGIKEIGVTTQYLKKRGKIDIENYQGKIPGDFFKLKQIINASSYVYNKNLITDDDNTEEENTKELSAVTKNIIGNEVNIQHRNVITSFKSGAVELLYLAFPLDFDGYLMVADDPVFSEALLWKVIHKLGLGGFKFPQQQLNDVRASRIAWGNLKKAARGEGWKPDNPLMEAITNDFRTLVTDFDKYQTDFKTLGEKEIINLTTGKAI